MPAVHREVLFDLLRQLRCCNSFATDLILLQKYFPPATTWLLCPGNQENRLWVKSKEACLMGKEKGTQGLPAYEYFNYFRSPASLHSLLAPRSSVRESFPSPGAVRGAAAELPGSQKCHRCCPWQSFIVQCPFSGR